MPEERDEYNDFIRAHPGLQCDTAEFARMVLNDTGYLDDFDFHEAAVKCGLLIPEKRTSVCKEDCYCAKWGRGDWKEFTCYRKHPILLEKETTDA